MKTKLISAIAIAVLAAAGCKKDDKNKADDKKPTAGKTTQDEKPAPEPKKWTAADTMKRVDECWGYWNNNKLDQFAQCYAEGATVTFVDNVPPMELSGRAAIPEAIKQWRQAFPDNKGTPQLVLVNGNNFAAIVLSTGTNSGELMGMPATNKEISYYQAQIGQLDDKGNVMVDKHIADQSTQMHQLGIAPNPMAPDAEEGWADTVRATAESSEAEAANVEVAKSLYDAVSKKESEPVAALLADDVMFRWVPSKDTTEDKKSYLKNLEQYYAMNDTLQKTVKESWAAGDWVVSVVETKAKLAGDIPGSKGTKGKEYNTTQFEFLQIQDGKVKKHWVFDNSLAMLVQVGAVDPSEFAPKAVGGDVKGGDKGKEMKMKKKK